MNDIVDLNRHPVNIETFAKLLDEIGYNKYAKDEEGDHVVLDIKGDETLLRLLVIVGKASNDIVWYTRFQAYSLEFEPLKEGVDQAALYDWLNLKNADLIFGRYYFHEKTDTVAFEISFPCNGGIHVDDFVDAIRIATVTVDKTHVELKGLPRAEGD